MMNQIEVKHDEINTFYKAQKITLYVLLGLTYSAFKGTQLGRIQAITNFNYTLHELLFVSMTLAFYLGPVIFLVYLFLFTVYVKRRGKRRFNIKSIVKVFTIIASIIGILIVMNHQSKEVSTAGIFILEQKVLVDGKYYLVIDDRHIKVSRNEFQLAEVNKEYLVSFVWNSRSPQNGLLETIEPVK
jgi:cation transport ATPase